VILPTVNERETIRAATLGYFATGLVDEVIVVNNNAVHGTSQEVAGTGAREIFEPRRGYGHALFCGIDHCDADIVILSKPDGAYEPGDVRMLLACSDEAPIVFGTRTRRESRAQGVPMGRFPRFCNWALAKLTQTLFQTARLSDVGCALRLFDREALMHIRPHLSARGARFDQQLLLEVISHGIPFLEAPVHFGMKQPAGAGVFFRTLKRSLRTMALVIEYRLGLVPCSHLPWRPAPMTRMNVDLPDSRANLAHASGSPVAAGPARIGLAQQGTNFEQAPAAR
jgi:glycosyltransferase involved in cell wall biosynthesis